MASHSNHSTHAPVVEVVDLGDGRTKTIYQHLLKCACGGGGCTEFIPAGSPTMTDVRTSADTNRRVYTLAHWQKAKMEAEALGGCGSGSGTYHTGWSWGVASILPIVHPATIGTTRHGDSVSSCPSTTELSLKCEYKATAGCIGRDGELRYDDGQSVLITDKEGQVTQSCMDCWSFR